MMVSQRLGLRLNQPSVTQTGPSRKPMASADPPGGRVADTQIRAGVKRRKEQQQTRKRGPRHHCGQGIHARHQAVSPSRSERSIAGQDHAEIIRVVSRSAPASGDRRMRRRRGVAIIVRKRNGGIEPGCAPTGHRCRVEERTGRILGGTHPTICSIGIAGKARQCPRRHPAHKRGQGHIPD